MIPLCPMCGFPINEGTHCVPAAEQPADKQKVNFECRVPVVTYNRKHLGTVSA